MSNTEEIFQLKLQNNFSIAMLDLPIAITSNSMLQRLKAVRKQTCLLKNSVDFMVSVYVLFTACWHSVG